LPRTFQFNKKKAGIQVGLRGSTDNPADRSSFPKGENYMQTFQAKGQEAPAKFWLITTEENQRREDRRKWSPWGLSAHPRARTNQARMTRQQNRPSKESGGKDENTWRGGVLAETRGIERVRVDKGGASAGRPGFREKSKPDNEKLP